MSVFGSGLLSAASENCEVTLPFGSTAANKLTLSAVHNIEINADLTGSGTASLALQYGQGAVSAGNTADYNIATGVKVNLPAGANFSTKLGSNGSIFNYTVITTLGAQGSSTGTDLVLPVF